MKSKGKIWRMVVEVRHEDTLVRFSLERTRRRRYQVCTQREGEERTGWVLSKVVDGSLDDVVEWCRTTYFEDPNARFRQKEENLRAFARAMAPAPKDPVRDFLSTVTPLVFGQLTRFEAESATLGQVPPDDLSRQPLDVLVGRLPDSRPGHSSAAEWREVSSRIEKLRESILILMGPRG